MFSRKTGRMTDTLTIFVAAAIVAIPIVLVISVVLVRLLARSDERNGDRD